MAENLDDLDGLTPRLTATEQNPIHQATTWRSGYDRPHPIALTGKGEAIRLAGPDDDVEGLGFLPLLTLIPTAISAIGPMIGPLAKMLGLGAGATHRDVFRRAQRHPKGRPGLIAAARVALRNHYNGRRRLTERQVAELERLLRELRAPPFPRPYPTSNRETLIINRPDGTRTVETLVARTGEGAPVWLPPMLPPVRLLGAAAPSHRPPIRSLVPARLPPMQDLIRVGRAFSRGVVEARVRDLMLLRVKLVSLRALERRGRLRPAGRVELARGIAIYRAIIGFLHPIRSYLQMVVPGAAALWDTRLLAGEGIGVVPVPVIVGGVVAVAFAVTGAALVLVAAAIAAAWSHVKAAETQAIEAETTRREGLRTTYAVTREAMRRAPDYAVPGVADEGLDALVRQEASAEESRQEASQAEGSGQIFGMPWYVVVGGAWLLMQSQGRDRERRAS